MNKNFKQVITFTLFMLFFAFLGGLITKQCSKPKEVVKYVKTIEKQIDTVEIEIAKVKEVIKEKEKERVKLKEQEKEIIYNEVECSEIVDNLKKQLENCDTVVQLKDTIIYKKEIVIEYKDKIIDKMVIPKPKPFGIGVQVGATTNLKEVKPYVGIGISYNLIRF